MTQSVMQRVRRLCGDPAGTAWLDDATVLSALTDNRTLVDREQLVWYERQIAADDVEYKRSRIPVAGLYEPGTTSASGTIQLSNGTAVTTGWTLDAEGWVNWTADQEGTAYYYTGWAYNVYDAAADLLEQRITALYDAVDFGTDNTRFSLSQQVTHLRDQVTEYRKLAGRQGGGWSSAQMVRSDAW